MANVDAALEKQVLMLRSDKGNRTHNITTRQITSGDESKYQNGLAGLRGRGIALPYPPPPTHANRCVCSDSTHSFREGKESSMAEMRGPTGGLNGMASEHDPFRSK